MHKNLFIIASLLLIIAIPIFINDFPTLDFHAELKIPLTLFFEFGAVIFIAEVIKKNNY